MSVRTGMGLVLVLVSALVLALVGCDNASRKTPEQIQAEVAASQKQFELERQRIEQENAAREARLVEQRSYIGVSFVAVSAERLDFTLDNRTGKSIDNLSGALEVFDLDGNYVTGIGLANWVPGDIYLPPGASAPSNKLLDLETEETRNRLLAGAPDFKYVYTVYRIQFEGEDEISYLEMPQITDTEPTVTGTTPEPVVDQLEPTTAAAVDACEPGQVSFETDEAYYPGPECAHLERNIDSERFKQAFIRRCQVETGAAAPPPFAARVQLSSCRKAEGQPGLLYRKQVCCDAPD